jgi:hypothetical protein
VDKESPSVKPLFTEGFYHASRVVAPGVAGSNPVAHPHEINMLRGEDPFTEEDFQSVF